eukprot:4542948-Pyramimonas_sp.AAC.1
MRGGHAGEGGGGAGGEDNCNDYDHGDGGDATPAMLPSDSRSTPQNHVHVSSNHHVVLGARFEETVP